jgi:hypothetical protein
MIRVLGTRRILTIAVLIALNMALAAIVYLYLIPQKMAGEKELRGLRGNISTVQSDISRMQVEFDQLEEQQARFDKLRDHGFFSTQGRREAELVFQRIQQESGVVSAVANILAGTVEENAEARKSDHQMLVSPVNIHIEAMDDVDVFRYIYLVQQFFPGHVSIERLTLERKAEITGTILRAIATGNNPQLVSADVVLMWRTMIPDKEVINAPVNQAGGQ